MEIIPFAAEHIPAAAALLARRHAADRGREPALPERFEDPEECIPFLQDLLPKGCGVAAFRRQGLAGYLITVNDAAHHAQRRALIPLEGHAIAAGEDGETYREMYAALAPALLRLGIFDHQVLLPVSDRNAVEAWFSLTFGERMHVAGRGLESVKGELADVDIRLAGPEQVEEVWGLFAGLGRYNTTPPLFVPDIYEDEAWRKELEEDLRRPENAFWTAYEDGEMAAVMYIRPTARMVFDRPPGTANLSIAFARKKARHGGFGTALLRRCVAWARDNGYQRIALDYFTYNLLGARFWQGHGFRPVATILQRRIDPRIAWADGTNE